MNKFYVLSILVLPILLSCRSSYKATDEMPEYSYNSRNSIDWTGSYRGITPGENGEAIQKTIFLDSNDYYRVHIKYPATGDTIVNSGTFQWNRAGNAILLKEPDGSLVAYYVTDGVLSQLDPNGNRITGAAASAYILTRERFLVTEHQWWLLELNGKTVTRNVSLKDIPCIRLNYAQHTFSGEAGCHSFSGHFSFSEVSKISFASLSAPIGSCKTALWDAFALALQSSDTYSITDGKLILSRAGIIPLAVFGVVKK